MGDSAHDFLGIITDSAGGLASGRMAFKVYALQRLHAANFRGVAAAINSRPVIRTGPGVPPGFGLKPWGPPALSPPSTLEASGASRAGHYHNQKLQQLSGGAPHIEHVRGWCVAVLLPE